MTNNCLYYALALGDSAEAPRLYASLDRVFFDIEANAHSWTVWAATEEDIDRWEDESHVLGVGIPAYAVTAGVVMSPTKQITTLFHRTVQADRTVVHLDHALDDALAREARWRTGPWEFPRSDDHAYGCIMTKTGRMGRWHYDLTTNEWSAICSGDETTSHASSGAARDAIVRMLGSPVWVA